ncbi:MAG: efflux RND transporter periplasmic adaptor subunit, partial [Blastocatellia bacterium]
TYDRRKRLYDQGGISIKDLEASQLAVKTAENDLHLSESTLRLHQASINPNDRAVAEAKVKQARDHLDMLNAQMSYAEIRAPFDGVITDQSKFQGDFVAPGDKLFTVADISQIIVKAPFPDTVATNLKTGDAADVAPADVPGQTISGSVTLVSRSGDPSSRTFEVWVTLPNKNGALRPGSSATVSVDSQTIPDAVTVPVSAVTLDAATAGSGSVMVVDDKSIAHEVKVKVGIKSGDSVQITSGLNGGETVVTEGNYALPDGTQVKTGGDASSGAEDADKDSDKDSDKDKDQ